MTDFSVELAAERIVDARTRAYFNEVYSSYANGNYRSAVVMLWSVVVCDLLFKLKELESTYGDPAAQAIMAEISQMQKASPKSPEWELRLLGLVHERTELLDPAEHTNLEALQRHRHLSAHPILTGNFELYSPNRETARAHIRNALEAALLKPAIMSKKVFDALVEDLAAMRDVLVEDTAVERYLNAKYLGHLSPVVENAIFRSLWKLTFKLTDKKCAANRAINYSALTVLYRRRPAEVRHQIENERGFYSDVSNDPGAMGALARFLAEEPRIYELLTDAARIPLGKFAESDPDGAVLVWFVHGKVPDHLRWLEDKAGKGEFPAVQQDAFRKLVTLAKDVGAYRQALRLGITIYIHSGNFNIADGNFAACIRPYVDDFDKDDLEHLLNGIEKNTQLYWRGRAKAEHPLIQDAAMKVLGAAFDPEAFPHFRESLTQT